MFLPIVLVVGVALIGLAFSLHGLWGLLSAVAGSVFLAGWHVALERTIGEARHAKVILR